MGELCPSAMAILSGCERVGAKIAETTAAFKAAVGDERVVQAVIRDSYQDDLKDYKKVLGKCSVCKAGQLKPGKTAANCPNKALAEELRREL
jgi:hypothetical protein